MPPPPSLGRLAPFFLNWNKQNAVVSFVCVVVSCRLTFTLNSVCGHVLAYPISFLSVEMGMERFLFGFLSDIANGQPIQQPNNFSFPHKNKTKLIIKNTFFFESKENFTISFSPQKPTSLLVLCTCSQLLYISEPESCRNEIFGQTLSTEAKGISVKQMVQNTSDISDQVSFCFKIQSNKMLIPVYFSAFSLSIS